MIGKGKPGMKFRQLIRKKTRNWTHLETDLFGNILVDSELNFCHTLETKGLKRSSNKEVFEAPQRKEFRTAFLDNIFLENNRKLILEGRQADLDISIEKLRNKYNNIKKSWRKNVDRARTSGLDVKKEPKWFQIMHPVLTDTNTVINSLNAIIN